MGGDSIPPFEYLLYSGPFSNATLNLAYNPQLGNIRCFPESLLAITLEMASAWVGLSLGPL
jgi:hypothetical protein